jgi:hypothetical protein
LTSFLIALASILVVIVGWLWLRSRRERPRFEAHPSDNLDTVTGWAPQATRVLSSAERSAYDTLRSALPAHTILAQVPLARFIKVPTRNSYAEWLRRVGHLCADLVVCDRHAQVIAVVEIHPAAEQIDPRVLKRRNRLTRVLKAANIPLHVWTENALPTARAVREAIAPAPAETDAVPGAAARSLPGRHLAPGPIGAQIQEPPPDLHEAPPETWFDDFDSDAAPLDAGKPKSSSR